MRATVGIESPEGAEVTMTFTMSLGAWKKLAAELAEANRTWNYPASKMVEYIHTLTRRMENQLTEREL